MKILMVYPRFPEETYWNALRSVKLFMRRRGEMPPLGLLTVASHLPADFEVRGVVLSDHVKSLDWRVRSAEYSCSAPGDVVELVLELFKTLL